MNITHLLSDFQAIQTTIVAGLSELEHTHDKNHSFLRDQWQRPDQQGIGISYVIENGTVFERGGVMFSHVQGPSLPPSATATRPQLAGASFQACGVSLVLHPRNPHIPTVHLNVRSFIAIPKDSPPVSWFGGGMDLTPYYAKLEDAQHFHRVCRDTLNPFGTDLYPRFKKNCDDYFYLKHRQEQRGIGGIFFDDFNEFSEDQSLAMTLAVGQNFLNAYTPIVKRHWNTPYTQAQRDFQAYRRGRYVEFNLIYDRGTLFGLQSNGRAEAILVSMPPTAQWLYNFQAPAGSAEAQLTDFLKPREWLQ